MRWPWKSKFSNDQFIVSWSAGVLAYVRARAAGNGVFVVEQMGIERQGVDNLENFARRLQALGLGDLTAKVMLRPEQYQLLQIDTPAVAAEELRAAARYQIRDMVSVPVDDILLDVMEVGDGHQKGTSHLFVAAATKAVVADVMALGDAMNWQVTVIDIQETAQRNLQSAMSRQDGRLDRADAALLVSDDRQAVLTISANEELFFTRRLELPAGFMSMAWGGGQDAAVDVLHDAFTPVSEYVPDYAGGALAQGVDYASGSDMDADRVQRVLVEVQRSLDLWDRSWSSMPLGGFRVFAGERSSALAAWLSREMGHDVTAIDPESLFPGLKDMQPADLPYCFPLLGVLLRTA